jgi:hypothetical protein
MGYQVICDIAIDEILRLVMPAVCPSGGALPCCFCGLGFLAVALLAVLGLAVPARFLGIVFEAARLAASFLGALPRFCFPLRVVARLLR